MPELEMLDAEGGPEAASSAPTLRDWLRLARGAARRRKLLVAFVFVTGVSAAALYYLRKTPLYRAEAIILAQRQPTLPSIGRSGVEDSPTRTAWELIHRRGNLVALLRAANLYGAPPAAADEPGTAPAGAAAGAPSGDRGDPAAAGAAGTRDLPAVEIGPQDDDPLDPLVLRLDKALRVSVEDGTIAISLDWPDPRKAHRIVEAAVQNFLEARHVQEVTAFDEVISVLQGRVAAAREQLERTSDEVARELRTQDRLPRRPLARVAQPSEELVRLRSMLEAKERAIQDVEEFRRRRLADLQVQLDGMRGVYSDAHPSVISLRQDIEALSRETPQMAALRQEERQLRQEYLARGGRDLRPGAIEVPQLPVSASAERPMTVDEDERVREVRRQYQSIVDRVNAAQLERDAVRAAFKYRYNVIWPPQVPKEPVSPDPLKVFGLGILASLFLALFVPAALELRSGRIVERWQIEKSLGLPVLGEVPRN